MKRFLALAIAGVMAFALTACTPDPAPPEEPTPPVVAADDLYLRLAGVLSSDAMMTVDGKPISAEVYLYWLSYTTSYYESYLQNYGQSIDWEEEMDGETLAEFLKTDAANTAKFYHIITEKAAEYGCTLTEAQAQELVTSLQDSIAAQGGQEEYDFQLRRLGISAATLTTINETPYLYENLSAKRYGDNVSADDLSAYINEQGTLRAKHILVRTVDDAREPLSEEEIADAKVRADDILAQIQAADDPEAKFDELMNEYSEDGGLATAPDGYIFGPGEMVTVFEDTTRSLAVGQIADDFVESEFGYHLIWRLEVPQDDALRAEYIDSLLRTDIDAWMAEATVSFAPAYDTIDAKAFHEAITAYRAELDAEHNPPEASEPAPAE